MQTTRLVRLIKTSLQLHRLFLNAIGLGYGQVYCRVFMIGSELWMCKRALLKRRLALRIASRTEDDKPSEILLVPSTSDITNNHNM